MKLQVKKCLATLKVKLHHKPMRHAMMHSSTSISNKTGSKRIKRSIVV